MSPECHMNELGWYCKGFKNIKSITRNPWRFGNQLTKATIVLRYDWLK